MAVMAAAVAGVFEGAEGAEGAEGCKFSWGKSPKCRQIESQRKETAREPVAMALAMSSLANSISAHFFC